MIPLLEVIPNKGFIYSSINDKYGNKQDKLKSSYTLRGTHLHVSKTFMHSVILYEYMYTDREKKR
jgi:hypothetical protein